jgi:hypothetical protein
MAIPKNFSIFLSPGGRFRMTPLYDVMSAQPNIDAGEIPRNRMKLAMAVSVHDGGDGRAGEEPKCLATWAVPWRSRQPAAAARAAIG